MSALPWDEAIAPSRQAELRLQSDRFECCGLELQIGPFAVEAARVVWRELQLVLEGSELRELKAAELEIHGARASADALQAGWSGAGRWQLDALAALEGLLRAFVTDAAWIVDADVSVPVQQGRIDFDRVSVEHIGPNSSLGLSHGGLYVDTPNLGRRYLYVFTAASVPGVEVEQRGGGWGARIADRGTLDIAALAQRLLADREPIGQVAGPDVEATFARTRLSGELQLGDGVLGHQNARLSLCGKATGKNRIAVSAPVLSQGLVLRLPELQGRDASFDWRGQRGHCDALNACIELEVSVQPKPKLRLVIDEMKLRALRLGAF
jgi:hypothetical protein